MTVVGLILAGGKSSRFQGEDKSWILWNGKPLIQHVIDRMAPQVDDIIISANSNIERYQATGHTVVSDDIENAQGPLAGIYTVMNRISKQQAKHDDIRLLTTPCDMPLIPENILQLINQSTHVGQICVAKDRERIQPLVALIPLSTLNHLKAFLDTGQRKVETWVLATSPLIVEVPIDTNGFYNINNQLDLSELRYPDNSIEGSEN